MDWPSPIFLTSFAIVCSDQYPKGVLVACPRNTEHKGLPGLLTKYKNPRGRYYEENHLEEWVARQPNAVFPKEDVLLLASQNYVFLQEKVDLLFIDGAGRFHVIEVKVGKVAKNNGVVPYEIYNVQVMRYVDYLKECMDSFPASLASEYRRFSSAFYGTSHDLAEILGRKFGESFRPAQGQLVREVYLVAGYDNYAVEYLSSHSHEDRRSIRLIYYQFYPRGQYIEFWEVPVNGPSQLL